MLKSVNFPANALTDFFEELAKQRHSTTEAVLGELAYRYLAEMPLEHLDDKQILMLADLQLELAAQNKLSDLLAHQSEGNLSQNEQLELTELMNFFSTMQRRKAQAMAEAINRGLRSPNLSDWQE